MKTSVVEDIIRDVPPYQRFLSVDEINQTIEDLAGRKSFDIGKSRNGEDIKCLKIGKGKKNALLLAFCHPHEPPGSLTLLYLCRVIALHDQDFTYYIVPCVNPDGVRLNEKWLTLPDFTLVDYTRHLYMPRGKDDMTVRYPFRYKGIDIDSPLPETRAIMNLIDKIKPVFVADMHNSMFSGVYYYISKEYPPLYPIYHRLVRENNVPISKSSPEREWEKKLADGIYRYETTEERYRWYKKLNQDPEVFIKGGGVYDYCKKIQKDPFVLLCEVPIFTHPDMGNDAPTDMTQREVFEYNVDKREETYLIIEEIYKVSSRLKNSPFKSYIIDYLDREPSYIERTRKWIAHAGRKGDLPAKISEKFYRCVLSSFWNMLMLGTCARMIEYGDGDGDGTLAEIERRINSCKVPYEKVKTQDMVRIQAGAVLYTSLYLGKDRG